MDLERSELIENPKMTQVFALVWLVNRRFRDKADDDAIAAVATADGVVRLTYGDVRALLSSAFEAGDRLQRIATWHSRETAEGGMVGDYCVECGTTWPCDTRRIADGTHEDDAAEYGGTISGIM